MQYRTQIPGIDGLRGISVAAVMLYHAEQSYCSAGYLGVEVFFVVSGFLITSLLASEQAAFGSISLREFYARRAWRLFPALAFMLLGSALIALRLAPDAWDELVADLPSAVFYFGNLWRIAQGESYFVAVDRPPLLLHLWSLAIEEQFYLVWPVLLGLSLRKLSEPMVGLLTGLLGLASLTWAALLFQPESDPSRLYYGTDTRLSGLMLGSALGLLLPHTTERSRLRSGLGVVGLACLLLSFTPLAPTGRELFRGGMLVVDLATLAVLGALMHRQHLAARVLSAPPLVWLGLRSYSAYLWHWPIFAVSRPEIDLMLGDEIVLALRLGLTLVCAELSYRLVEEPLRRGVRSWPAVLAFSGMAAAIASVVATTPVDDPQHALTTVAYAASDAPGALEDIADVTHEDEVARVDDEEPTAPAITPRADRSAVVGGLTLLPLLDDLRGPAERVGVDRTEVGRGVALDPRWPKTLTVLTDSVALGLRQTLPAALPGFRVEFVGRPALMVKRVVPDYLLGRDVGSVVVIALGHNSLFRKDREEWSRWAGAWDRYAEQLLRDVRARGAKKIVWVTLREPSPSVVTERGLRGYTKFAWFFPYVNERIYELGRRYPELAIADWEAVSDVPGLTNDLIHLSAQGRRLMARVIADAVLTGSPPAGLSAQDSHASR